MQKLTKVSVRAILVAERKKEKENVDAFTRLLRAVRTLRSFGRFEKNEIFVVPPLPADDIHKPRITVSRYLPPDLSFEKTR